MVFGARRTIVSFRESDAPERKKITPGNLCHWHPGSAVTVRSLYPIEVSDLAHSCEVWMAPVRLSVRAEHVL